MEKVYGNLLCSIQSAIDFFDLLAGLGRRRMDGTDVGCRYFGLGDDRPYFHSPSPLHSQPHPCILLQYMCYTCREISRIRAKYPISFMCRARERNQGKGEGERERETDFSNLPETR